ncbi:glycosyltransferase family 2 protein [Aureimonas frigidaquae]|uniref:glycosyltransferase family 2 protein n=1 Tax=Aureimonas frigidaquae TaxID=424757 RepID=UPI000785328C|nr:glycosyltransferase family A protein [Aureimonas frigidaquae]
MITDRVAVIIAAMNASATIGCAVASALADRHVAEVIVVDDASSDDTGGAARAADDGTGRLIILRQDCNTGPAAARNRALDACTAPLVAILDADDFLLPGRFAALLAAPDWDFAADDIVFVPAERADEALPAFASKAPRVTRLGTVEFVEGNISRRGHARGEIGFLKPVMRTSFLEAHGLRYREDLRLGEDYEFYVRALMAGARYVVVHNCGYAAVVRGDSLSGRHSTQDLRQLWLAGAALAAGAEAGPVKAMLERHARHIHGRYVLRDFLDRKARKGLFSAGLESLSQPRSVPAIVSGVARDKLDALARRVRPPVQNQGLRTLSEGWPVG